jgi:pyrophosphatase PpaX
MQTTHKSLSCVIFDIDGTLTRTNELIFASFNHVAAKYLGREYAPHEIIALFGPPEEGAVEALFGRERMDAIMDELCTFYERHHASLASLHPGIDAVLAYLKSRGITLAVFTGKGRRTTRITLDALHIAHYFDLIVSGNDVARHKPDPEGIRKVLAAYSLAPSEALMVGDSLADIKASQASGVPVAAVVWDSYDRDRVLQAGANFVFHDTGAMLQWFRSCVN